MSHQDYIAVAAERPGAGNGVLTAIEAQACGAWTRNHEGRCGQPAGWGTHHEGWGKCKLHGGASRGAPKGNRNAVRTGEYETLRPRDATERAVWRQIRRAPEPAGGPWDWRDAAACQAIEREILLNRIRERRMLLRIRELRNLMDDGRMLLVEDRRSRQRWIDPFAELLRLEEALTRVQGRMLRLIRAKRGLRWGAREAERERAEKVVWALEAKRSRQATVPGRLVRWKFVRIPVPPIASAHCISPLHQLQHSRDMHQALTA